MMKDGPVARVLEMVRQRTGKAVRLESDPQMPPNFARLEIARGGAPFHLIALHPDSLSEPDYWVAFHAGGLLRRFAVPAAQRREFAERPKADDTVRGWVQTDPKTGHFPRSLHPGWIQLIRSGLLSQLESTPGGLRVDEWIHREFPELVRLQLRNVESYLKDITGGLLPEVQRAMPTEALRTSLGMNAAFASYWARVLDRPKLIEPYRAVGGDELGAALLEAWDRIPSGPEADYDLVDAWAELLGMTGWYQWLDGPSS